MALLSFAEIYDIAASRKGGSDVVEKGINPPKSNEALRAITDDRWLSCMSKCIFNAGFNWKVVDQKWSGFEAAFDGFDLGRCSMMNHDDLDRLVSDTRIIRHGTKIRSVQENAHFLNQIMAEHGSVGGFFADWPADDYVGLLALLKKRGSRLGGSTGQYFLRFMGVESFITSNDVVARLILEGVIDKPPSSKASMKAVQSAFNQWKAQSGRSLTEISRVLAQSV